jgi:hypothetical protein
MGDDMTFQEAKAKLKEIADGKYHAIEYKLTEYAAVCGGGDQKPECTVYINGLEHHRGLTWEEAFVSLDRAINGVKVNEDEAPDAVGDMPEVMEGVFLCGRLTEHTCG